MWRVTVGSLRTLFALSVVFAHCLPDSNILVGGPHAVRLFYIISGFLISYVLVERRTYPSVSAFYANRYLRLYPIYACVAVITLLGLLLAGESAFTQVYRSAPPGAVALLTLSNLLLFGQDWVMFAGVQHHALVFTPAFNDSAVILYRGLLVPQAWTLGVELSFYLIAPWVLPRRGLVYGLLIGSLGLRAALVLQGVGLQDPWTYRFFPTELALFLCGALAHQILRPLYQKLSAQKLSASHERWAANAATASIVLLAVIYPVLPLGDVARSAVMFAVFITLLPLTFTFQARYRFDRWIGELSYPIYIVHTLVIRAVVVLGRRYGLDEPHLLAAVSVVLTVACAIGLNHFIARPFEVIRDRMRTGREPGPRAAAVPAA